MKKISYNKPIAFSTILLTIIMIVCNVESSMALVVNMPINIETLAQNNDDAAEQSMKLFRQGWAHQKAGNNDAQALALYLQSIEVYPHNPYALMAAATLLGSTKEAIAFLKTANLIFLYQDNQEFYNLTNELLKAVESN